MITNGHSTDWRGRSFRRRRYLPGLILVALMAVLVMIVWAVAFNTNADEVHAASCNRPDTAGDPNTPALGHQVDGSLSSVDPAPLWNTRIRVYNANGQSGQAAHVAAGLSDAGFGQAADTPVANDPIYTHRNLQCQGQIRFGADGEAAARTLSLMVPCAELIEDDRDDGAVDLALGTLFSDLAPNADADAVLKALRVPDGAPAPDIDSALITGARAVRC